MTLSWIVRIDFVEVVITMYDILSPLLFAFFPLFFSSHPLWASVSQGVCCVVENLKYKVGHRWPGATPRLHTTYRVHFWESSAKIVYFYMNLLFIFANFTFQAPFIVIVVVVVVVIVSCCRNAKIAPARVSKKKASFPKPPLGHGKRASIVTWP
jgi:hypothetical protein